MNAEINQVEYLTQLAHNLLQKRNDAKAIHLFKKAHKCANRAPCDDILVAKATVNLGAALISVHRPHEALKILDRAFVSLPSDNAVAGDLLYNLSLLHQQLGNKLDARKYLQNSFDHYDRLPDCKLLQAGIACKLAAICAEQSDYPAAVDAYEKAASIYGLEGHNEQRALCLYHKALAFEASGNILDAVAVANDCESVCSKSLEPSSNVGRLYNELGLFLAKYKNYSKAVECFNKSLTVIQVVENGSKFEAVVLQNIGAVHNCQSSFKQSIDFNKRAAKLHVQTSCRNGQGQCFINIAYACSQLNDLDSAGEYYLHALQAMQDTGDKNGEWQALEGLCTIAFKQNKLERCCDYIRKALIATSANYSCADHLDNSRCDSDTHLEIVQQRLFNKLSQVLRLQRLGGSDEIAVDKSPAVVLKEEVGEASNAHTDDSVPSFGEPGLSTSRKKNVRQASPGEIGNIVEPVQTTSSAATYDMGDTCESSDLEAEKLQEQLQKFYSETDKDEEDEDGDQTCSCSEPALTEDNCSANEVFFPSSAPQHTAHQIPQRAIGTYLVQVNDDQVAAEDRLGQPNPAAGEPIYMSIPAKRHAANTDPDLPQSRDKQEVPAGRADPRQESPPTLPQKNGFSIESSGSDIDKRSNDFDHKVVKLPKKAPATRSSTPSQACCTM